MTVDLHPITLPKPVFDRCRTVFEALKMKRTSRSIRDERIPLQILSDIFWAAQGVNRVQGPFGDPGQGSAGANAPVRLIYVVDIDRFKHAGFQEPGLYDPEIQKSCFFVDTGMIAQNAYLASSALGLDILTIGFLIILSRRTE
jgi:hypothetical protein